MSKSKKATRAVLLVSILTFGSKLLGFLREALMASKFGSQGYTDVFFMALSTITLFSTIITQSIGTTLIPVLSEVEAKEGKEAKREHLTNFLNMIGLTSLAILIVAWIFTPILTSMIAPGFHDEKLKLAITLTRIGLPSLFFSGIAGVFTGYLQSEGYFVESALSMSVRNIVIIIFLMFFAQHYDLKVLMFINVLASFVALLPLLRPLRASGYRYSKYLDIHDQYMKKVIYLIPPVLVSVSVEDFNKLFDTSLASRLPQGSISALNYATRLETITTSIFVTAIVTVIFPMLSDAALKDDKSELHQVIRTGLNTILMITIPATVGMVVLAHPIVKLAFERGAFTPDATIMTAGALTFYSLGIIGGSIKHFVNRIFYSLHDTKTPVLISVLMLGFNILLSLWLIGPMQHRGLALGTSIASVLTAGIFLYLLRRKIGPFGFGKIANVAMKTILSAAVMGVGVYFSYEGLLSILGSGKLNLIIALFTSVILGVLIYVIMMYILGVEELKNMLLTVRKKVVKK